MIHLYNRETIVRASTLSLDRPLRELLAARIAALKTEYGDLTDHTEFLVVEPGDTEADFVRHAGFSPLVDPIDGHRWPNPQFRPGWDYLGTYPAAYQLNFSFGSTFGQIVLIERRDGVWPEALAMCACYSSNC